MASNGTQHPTRLTFFDLSGSRALGGAIHVDVAHGCTVLVGHNGAGKSLILEGLYCAASNAVRLSGHPGFDDPSGLTCEWDNGRARLRYHYDWELEFPQTVPGVGRLNWDESFDVDGRRVWSRSSGQVRIGRRSYPVIGERSVLSEAVPMAARDRAAQSALKRALTGVSHVGAGLPRAAGRREVDFKYDDATHRWEVIGASEARLAYIGDRLLSWPAKEEESTRFIELAHRSRVLKKVWNRRYRAEGRSPNREKLAQVTIDGANLGVLADGTLRVLEILVRLVDLKPGDTLLIEEPETGVHPGLLERLLHEIEAFTASNQVILSTHSPQVVSWASAEALRLVAREADKTTVRTLTPTNRAELESYLADQGTAGEYVFSGAFDS